MTQNKQKKKVFTLIVNFFKANEPVIVHER